MRSSADQSLKKLLFGALLLAVVGATFESLAAEIHLYCRSIRSSPVRLDDPTETLDLTTDRLYPPILNGELEPGIPPLGSNYLSSIYVVTTPRIDKLIDDEIYFGLPPYSDTNNNGIPDFFEVTQPLDEVRTDGFFDDAGLSNIKTGFITTIWSREAGSDSGLCLLQFLSKVILRGFPVPFQLLEYDGTLEYKRTSGASLIGQAKMTSTSGGTILQTVDLTIVDRDHLLLRGTYWSEGSNFSVAQDTTLERKGANYVGVLNFDDGDRRTPLPDYKSWFILISDDKDSNGDGVPDLSDPPQPASPLRISIAQVDRQFTLSVRGDLGKRYDLQFDPELKANTWQVIQTLTLSQNPQILLLPIPTGPGGFYRLAEHLQ